MARQSLHNIDDGFSALAADFDSCLAAYEERGPFSGRQLALHLETIALRRQLGSAAAAARSGEFADLLYATLHAWRIGVRSSTLVPRAAFGSILRRHAAALGAVDGRRIDDADLVSSGVSDRLWELIKQMPIVENQAKLVAATKTLHHLLPDLVPPMDRAWTGRFLGLSPAQWQPLAKQEWIFETTLLGLARVARAVQPGRYVGQGWQSSATKVLDNALVGYVMRHLPRATSPSSGDTETRAPRRRSYEALAAWLGAQNATVVRTSFAEIERVIGCPLPASARRHRTWWANHFVNTQARGWMSAGRTVLAVDLGSEAVTFG